jgi:hypothetical protein
MTSKWILAVSLILAAYYTPYHFTTAQGDFGSYPVCSQGCFTSAADTAGITLTGNPLEDNPKLCSNVQFLQSAVKCIVNSCGENTLGLILQDAEDGCDSTGTPLALSVQQLLQLGESALSTSSSSLITSSTTSSSTSSSTSTLSSTSTALSTPLTPTSSSTSSPSSQCLYLTSNSIPLILTSLVITLHTLSRCLRGNRGRSNSLRRPPSSLDPLPVSPPPKPSSSGYQCLTRTDCC